MDPASKAKSLLTGRSCIIFRRRSCAIKGPFRLSRGRMFVSCGTVNSQFEESKMPILRFTKTKIENNKQTNSQRTTRAKGKLYSLNFIFSTVKPLLSGHLWGTLRGKWPIKKGFTSKRFTKIIGETLSGQPKGCRSHLIEVATK